MALSNLAMPVIASSYPARGYEMTSDQKAIVDRAFDMYNTTWTPKKMFMAGTITFLKKVVLTVFHMDNL